MIVVCVHGCYSNSRRINVGDKFRLKSEIDRFNLKLYNIKLYTLGDEFVTNVSNEEILCRYFEDER